MTVNSPLKQVLDIRRHEWPFALPMGLFFFLVIATFWILKPIKKGTFIGYYQRSGFDLLSWHMSGAQAELLAKVLNMVVAFAAVAAFTAIVRTLRRQRLVYVFCAFFALCLMLFTPVLDHPSGTTVWAFYLFGDLYSTLMVATFFAFLNDSVDPDAAKRLYGLVGVGGVAGGAVGSTVVSANIERLSSHEWLYACVGITVVVAALAGLAGRHVTANGDSDREATQRDAPGPGGNPALEGARLVFRSRYLLAIVAVVGLYEMASTIMDFQFSATVSELLRGRPAAEIKAHFSMVFATTNWIALIVQLFLTSFVMRRFGVGIALLVLPVAALSGSAAFLAWPVLLTGSALNTCDNGFSYSINQSAKEVLYVPTARDEKYKAKAFIDMFVQRFAKALAVGLSLVITTWFTSFASVRWLSLATAALLVLWIFAARYAGEAFRKMEASPADRQHRAPRRPATSTGATP